MEEQSGITVECDLGGVIVDVCALYVKAERDIGGVIVDVCGCQLRAPRGSYSKGRPGMAFVRCVMGVDNGGARRARAYCLVHGPLLVRVFG